MHLLSARGVVALAILTAGCSASFAETPHHAAAPHAAQSSTPTLAPTVAAVAARARSATQPASSYVVARTDAYPHLKQLAVTTVERLTGGRVVYPQMGGITADAASVMVVTDVHGNVRTIDVRLSRVAGVWKFDRIASMGGSPLARPARLSREAIAVLTDPRISLPDSAKWDIYRGAISSTLLTLMEEIAKRTPYAVTVLDTGHPFDVFGTSHQSMHTMGRAVDINALNGRHIVDMRSIGSPAYSLVQWLMAQLQVGQVGSPWDLDGGSPRGFTNSVHLDHIHISV